MSTEDVVRRFLLENYLFTTDDNALENADSLLEKGVVDSTGMMELVNFIEEQFHIRVEDDEMVPANLDSVAAIAGYVARKVNATTPNLVVSAC